MDYIFKELTEADARDVLSWRYDPPYDMYNADPAQGEENVATLLDPDNRYFAATAAEGQLVGYCCYGPDARVAGGDYRDPGALDVGLGMRPDLTGQGHGHAFFNAVLAFGRERCGARRYRLSVAAFNRRAILVYARARFRPLSRFRRGGRPDGLEFVIMIGGG